MRFLTALLVVALLYAIFALRIPSTHAQTCAPLIPPPLSGSPAPASPGLLFINEVLSKPKAPWYCPTTYSVTNAPWIELYNPQDQAFDLYTVHASIDTGPNTQPYYLPLGAAIAAHGYLVLFPAMYTNTLTAGTTLRLVISTVVIDQMIVPSLGLDQSYARVPDGANSWQITNTPTIDASNTSLQAQATPTSLSTTTSSSTYIRSGRGSSSGYNGTTTGRSSTKIVSGVQPKWNILQLPGTVTISNSTDTTTNTSSQTSSPPISSPTASSSIDISHLLLMALLGVALAVVLFWCWRLFSSP